MEIDTAYSIHNVTDPGNPITLIENSLNYSTEDELNEQDPMIDGLRIFLFNNVLAWDSLNTGWKSGNSNWSIRMDKTSIGSNVSILVPVDYEVRFGEMGVDTAIFDPPIPVPFEVWNVTENVKENFVVIDKSVPPNGQWDSGEPIIVVEGDNIQNFPPIYWQITIKAPEDTTIESTPPENGGIASLATRKPFNTNDIYTITTTVASIPKNLEKSTLDNIKVVPNPYIVSNRFEQSSVYTGGNFEHRLQFIHLPQRCTIRIFNLRGYLIDTIEHDSDIDDGSEFWLYLSHQRSRNWGKD
jgi:hypothetical protein